MHELSIALSIVELAEEEAATRNTRILAVHLNLGCESGVVKEALLASYEMACAGTVIEGAPLLIEEIPAGREIEVRALEIDE
jgi:hydrogenase nickel incorporation protein HypA/HybF